MNGNDSLLKSGSNAVVCYTSCSRWKELHHMKVQRISLHRRKNTTHPLFWKIQDDCLYNRLHTKRIGSSVKTHWRRVGYELETRDERCYFVRSPWCQVHRAARDGITDEEPFSSADWKRHWAVAFDRSFSLVSPALYTLGYDRITSFYMSVHPTVRDEQESFMFPKWRKKYMIAPVFGQRCW